MEKKKQIEEMARDFGEKKGYGCRAEILCTCKECILQCDCMPYSYAEGAYNAGYRKESETAKDILRLVKKNNNGYEGDMDRLEKAIRERYGVGAIMKSKKAKRPKILKRAEYYIPTVEQCEKCEYQNQCEAGRFCVHEFKKKGKEKKF